MIKSSQFQIQEKPHQRLSGVGKFPLLQEKEKKCSSYKLLSSFLPSFLTKKAIIQYKSYFICFQMRTCLQQSAQNAETNLGVEYD